MVDRALTLGRDADVDVTLNDALVSTRHATLSPNADGSVMELTDLSSTNGTFVDDQRVEGSTTLRGGERIRLGKVVLEVEGTMVGGGAGTVVAGGGGGGETRLAGAGDWKLVVSGGPSAGAIVALAEGTQVIGRDAASDIVIDDAEVSSRHASVTRTGDAVRLKDLGSLNGTKVNGERITQERTLERATGSRSDRPPSRSTTARRRRGRSCARCRSRRRSRPAAAKPAAIPSQPFQPGRVASAPAPKRGGVASGKAIAVIGVVVVAAAAVIAFAVTNGDDSSPKAAATTAAATPTNTGPLNAAQLIAQNRDATVQVLDSLPGGRSVASGTGSVIDAKNGYVLTNNHVAVRGSAVRQPGSRKDGQTAQVPVTLVAAAPCEDLALLQITDVGDRSAFTKQVQLGDSASIAQGVG